MSYGNQTFGYNANGDMTSRTAHLGQAQLTTQYSYDAIGNMTGVILADGTNIEYIVDGKNRRIGKKVNGATVQKFVYLNQLEPVAELNADNTVKTLFVYGTKPHVPEYLIKDGEKYRVVSDERGSVRLVVKLSDGTIAQRIDYDEFGNVLTDTNPGFQPFYFAGGIYDLDTKLTKFGARDYDAKIGRWTSKDPIRFDGGFNHYNYCDGDPVNKIDVNGRYPIVIIVVTAAAVTAGAFYAFINAIEDFFENKKEVNNNEKDLYDSIFDPKPENDPEMADEKYRKSLEKENRLIKDSLKKGACIPGTSTSGPVSNPLDPLDAAGIVAQEIINP